MRYTQKKREKRRKQNIINNVHEPLAIYGPEGKHMLFLGMAVVLYLNVGFDERSILLQL